MFGLRSWKSRNAHSTDHAANIPSSEQEELHLICVQVIFNDVVLTQAGASSAESIDASVSIYPGFSEAWLHVTSEISLIDKPPVHAEWARTTLKIGDVVQFRLIESSEASAPRLGRVDPSVTAADDVPFICGYCSKPAHEVDGMITGNNAMACNERVRMLLRCLPRRADVY
jgi:hypothetical protein